MTSSAVSAQGTTFAIDTGGGSPTWSSIANIKDFSGLDGSAGEIDVTNLASSAKEFRLGLVDNGQFSFNLDTDLTDAGQAALRTHWLAGSVASFKLTLPGTTMHIFAFSGYVRKFTIAGGVDAVVKSSCEIKISGAVTVT